MNEGSSQPTSHASKSQGFKAEAGTSSDRIMNVKGGPRSRMDNKRYMNQRFPEGCEENAKTRKSGA